jgi:hypothetical protein
VREDDRTNAKTTPSSARNSPDPSASTAVADNTTNEVQDDSSGGGTLDLVQNDNSDDGD